MGKYHSKVSEAAGRGSTKTEEQIVQAFDYALAHPKAILSKVGPMFGCGSSSMANWLYCPPKVSPNIHVIAWLQSHDSLDGSGPTRMKLWEKRRPNNRINDRVRDVVERGVIIRMNDRVSLTAQLGQDRLTSPNGIGTFVPGATDDLLVVKQAALDVKAEAESVAQSATELAIAIDTVRDWMSTTDKLQLALGRIQSLEQQLRTQDEVVRRFQQQKLASNQVHSTD